MRHVRGVPIHILKFLKQNEHPSQCVFLPWCWTWLVERNITPTLS